MFKEGAYAEAEENAEESIEHSGGFSEKSLTEFLETHHSIVNSGNNGIILKFSREELPPEIQEGIDHDIEENPEGSVSIKVLKIYNLSTAKEEFESLKKAREIVKNSKDHAPLAHVPKASGFYNIKVSEKLQKTLNENGASIVDGKVGLIVMDYIEGVDLATLLYQEALERLHGDGDIYAIEDVQSMQFDELAQIVSAKLHFSKPGGKSRNENEQQFEEEKVKAENAQKLFNALEKSGFVLPREVLEQLGNTIKLWHNNDFYHNDLHERQVIIKDRNLKNPQAFVVDYGTASEKSEAIGDTNIKPMDDEAIVRRLTPLTKTETERREKRNLEVTREWEERITTIEQQPRLKKQFIELQQALAENSNALEMKFALSSSSDTDLQNFLASLIKLSRENPNNRSKIIEFLSTHENDQKKRPFFLKKLQEAKKII